MGNGVVMIDSAYLVSQGFTFNDNDANSCGVDQVLLSDAITANVPKLTYGLFKSGGFL